MVERSALDREMILGSTPSSPAKYSGVCLSRRKDRSVKPASPTA